MQNSPLFFKKNLKKNRKGFSLIELLIALTIIPVIAVVLYGNLSSGLKIWTKLNYGLEDEDRAIFIHKISRDCLQAFKYANIEFLGEKQQLQFASQINAREVFGGDRGIGQIAYSYDASKKQILRVEKDVGQLFKNKLGKKSILLANVEKFSINYFYQDPATKQYLWVDEWPDPATLPVAVRFYWETGSWDERKTYQKTIFIPTGGA